MARRKKTVKKSKSSAKRASKARRPARAKARARRAPARKPRKAAPRRRTAPRPSTPPSANRIGAITHTELASADPAATRAWCERVLGWKFETMPTPAGPYDMWRFAIGTGGGLRANNPPEAPGSIPYCEVASIRETYGAALAAGATEMLAPQALPGEMGWIAIVAAPGGVAFGFWAMK